MKKTSSIFIGIALCIVGVASMAPRDANAAERQPNVRTERTPAMREFVFKRLSRARDLAEKGEIEQAIKLLDDMRGQGRTNSYETAMLWNLYAYLYYSQENYGKAIEAYRNVVNTDGIPQSLHTSTLYSLAQLHIAQGDYDKALVPLQQWFEATEKPGARAWVFLSQVHLQVGNLDKASSAIRAALDQAHKQAETPEEQWLQLARAIYYQQRNFERLRDVLASLALSYPKREYWIQLGAVFAELGQEKRQIASLEAAYEQGWFEKESDYVSLAQLLLGNEVPFKAARILEEGIEKKLVERNTGNLRLLADAYTMAREYKEAVDTLNVAAANADDGELYLRLAQVQLDRTNWEAAASAAVAALQKGGLDRPDVAHIIRGLAAFNLRNYDTAIAAFRRAGKFEASRETAQQWLEHVEREQSRQRQLEAMLERQPQSSQRGDELARTANELTIGS